jgi:hypothetical protein
VCQFMNSIIAQERLDRITQFASEIALDEPVPDSVKEQDQVSGDFVSSNGLPYNDWTEHAVPVNSISGLFSSSVFHLKEIHHCIYSGAGSLILLKVYMLVRFQNLVMEENLIRREGKASNNMMTVYQKTWIHAVIALEA